MTERLRELRDRVPPFWLLQIGGWAAYGLLIYMTLLPTVHPGGGLARLATFKTVRTLIGLALSLVLRAVYKRLRARGTPAVTLGAAAVAGSVLVGAVWNLLYRAFGLMLDPAGAAFSDWSQFPRDVMDVAYVLFAWSASYFGIKYWQDLQEERERRLRATALAREAQLEMLRYQVNPHFLFNALNSIRASIDEDPERARDMVTELSEFLRYSLLLDADAGEVPLGEEIRAVDSYLAIERIRFEDKLDVTFDVDPSTETFLLPSFIVHPLVENAIKHGMRGGATPLRVRIASHFEAGRLRIEVANTGGLADAAGGLDAATAAGRPAGARRAPGAGIGLANIRRRLDAVFGKRGTFELFERDGWTHAVIEVAR